MLLTKKSEYAILALVNIAKSNEPKNVDQLATELNISKSFLAKILQNLAKNDILNSYKGNNGGFTLKKDCADLTILEISKIAEQKLPLVFECTTQLGFCSGSLGGGCTLFPVLNNLQNKINGFLNQLTLKDIL
ncbi:MAG: Rrf2 family transcriptional regulator [Campylobacterales bacterium]|nr:Rrf2 family transcriptional regulator [Campylobacterales bacterium]